MEESWCLNWKAVIYDNAKPVGIIPKFQKGFGSANSKKGSKAGSAGSSVISPSEIGDNDVGMNIEEEKKVAVPSNLETLESNSNLGKRLS